MIKRYFIYLATLLPVVAGWAAEQPQVQWLLNQQNTNTWLFDSYEGDGTNAAWIYDQALAVIALTDAGLIAGATSNLNTMQALQLTEPAGDRGAWHECYDSATTNVVEAKLVSGPIAWMVMAINFYEARTGDTNFALMALGALDYLGTMVDTNPANETYGAVRFSNEKRYIFSTEHNLDAYSAHLYRGLLSASETNLAAASNILRYLAREMWILSTNCNAQSNVPVFWEGWTNFSFSTDPKSWAVLALGPLGTDGEPFYKCMEWVWANQYGNTRNRQDYDWNITNVDGFKSGTGEWPTNYIWVEATDGVAAAFRRVGDYGTGGPIDAGTNWDHADYFHSEMARTANCSGALVHSFSDCRPWSYRFPDNARWNHIASVAWHYFNERSINPFSPDIPWDRNVEISTTAGTSGVVHLEWPSEPGWPYKVQWRTNLPPNVDRWHDLGASTNATCTNTLMSVDTHSRPQCFYRVVLGK